MTDHQFLALMIGLQTVGFAFSFAYLARISHQVARAVERVADTTTRMDANQVRIVDHTRHIADLVVNQTRLTEALLLRLTPPEQH